MKCIKKGMEAEVTYTDSKNRQWRYQVSLVDRTCLSTLFLGLLLGEGKDFHEQEGKVMSEETNHDKTLH
jgi:hypothetical protein